MPACHLIVDPPAAGVWNMAVDEALLFEVAADKTPVLRFYQWEEPTLSLGYFQKYAVRHKHTASLNATLVRRLSGGGAILHDQEITYSLMLPGDHPLANEAQTLYRTIHQALAQRVNDWLGETTRWRASLCEKPTRHASTDEPFLCFQRRATGDILLQPTQADSAAHDYKIVGSAQRRRRGAILQHGSLLLAKSAAAPELLGLTDLTGLHASPSEVIDSLIQAFTQVLQLELTKSELSRSTREVASKLSLDKYSTPQWSESR